MPDSGNIVRFPVELRVPPSLLLLCEIAPYLPEVELMAEACGLEMPEDGLCDRVDAETASYIAEQVLPLHPDERRRALEEMLRRVLAAAVEACRRASTASGRLREARGKLRRATKDGGYWLAALEAKEAALHQEAAELLVLAEQRCREARGVDRAVTMALRGEPWVPARKISVGELGDWLIEAHAAGKRC